MKGELYIADRDNLDVVLCDLNEVGHSEGQGTGFGLLGDLDLGRVEVEPTWITSSKPGAVQANVRRPVVDMRFRLWFQFSSLDETISRVAEVQRHIQQGGILAFKPQGATNRRYIEFYPSPIPALFDGKDLIVNKVTKLYFSNEGLDVRLWRYPDMFSEPVQLGTNSLSNGGTRAIVVNNPGSLPAKARIKVVPEVEGAKLVDFIVGRRTRGDLASMLTGITLRVDDADILYNDTTGNVTDSAADDGQCAETTFSTRKSMRRRWRHVFQAPHDADYIGLWRVYGVVRTVGDTNAPEGTPSGGDYRIQLRYANGDVNPVEVTNQAVEVNFSDTQFYQYTTVDLGLVRVTKQIFTLEGWARLVRDNDTDPVYPLRWDQITLIPVDEEHCRVTIPGYLGSHTNETEYSGSELDDVSGTTIGSATAVGSNAFFREETVALNHVGEKVRLPDQPDTLVAGHHHFRARLVVRNKDEDTPGHRSIRVGWLEIRDNSGTLVAKRAIRTKWGRETTEKTYGVYWNANGAISYQFLVRMTNKPNNTEARVTVKRVKWFNHRYATKTGTNKDQMILDGIRNKAVLRDPSLDEVSRLVKKGDYIDLAPGNNLLIFHFGEMPPSNYDDVVNDQAEVKSDPSATYTVTVDAEPRYSA